MAQGLQIIVEVSASSLYASLTALDDNLDAGEVAKDAASIILNHTRQRFLQERDPDGNPWPPSQAGIDRRAAGGTGTLFDTGTLWRSIQEVEGNGTQMGLFGDTAEIVIEAGAYNKQGVEYGHFHQYGTKYLPIRRFMGINDGDVEMFEGRLLQRCAEALGVA